MDTITDLTIRAATVDDADLIVKHHHIMFEEMDIVSAAQLEEMTRNFSAWLPDKLANGSYLGWLIEAPDGTITAGAGLWLFEAPANPVTGQTKRAHIVDVYTYPTYRGRGLAKRLMGVLLDWCREHDYKSVSLRASNAGRPMYEKMGFQRTAEMSLLLE